jgi:hypothetical protein
MPTREVFGGYNGYGQLRGPILAWLPKFFTSSALLTGFSVDSEWLSTSGNATKHADSAIYHAVDDAFVAFVVMCVASLRLRCCVMFSIGWGNMASSWHPKYVGTDQTLDPALDIILRRSDVWTFDLQLFYHMRIAVHSTELQQRMIGDVLKIRMRKQWIVQEVMQDDAQRLETTAPQKQSHPFPGCVKTIVVER